MLENLPLDGVDVVIDCTGAFRTEAKLAPYFAAGVSKVVVSAPVKDGPTANIVYGVNTDDYDPAAPRRSRSSTPTLDVGFSYMSNAAGRLLGTVLSGASYQLGGLPLCLATAAGMVALSAIATGRLSRP